MSELGQARSCGCFRSTSAQATQAEFQGAPLMSRSCRHRTSVANPRSRAGRSISGSSKGPGARCDTAVSEVLHGNKRLSMAMVRRLRARFRCGPTCCFRRPESAEASRREASRGLTEVFGGGGCPRPVRGALRARGGRVSPGPKSATSQTNAR